MHIDVPHGSVPIVRHIFAHAIEQYKAAQRDAETPRSRRDIKSTIDVLEPLVAQLPIIGEWPSDFLLVEAPPRRRPARRRK
jgi:hypothetical protein